ncbi:helix-turn-helix domain-containing protein [Paenibacillus gansuensis]|uniref:Helix-turn-helix domain-containing protein n=1 Tax=Paenibacillus gansuensis TaxID=306542 RepID=A0ABW5PHK8_9BACL
MKFEFIFRSIRGKQMYIAHHSHNCFELVYYLEGKGETEIGENTYQFGPGSYCVIRPGTMHDERRTEDTDVIFFGFSCDDHALMLPEGMFQDEDDLILNLLHVLYEEFSTKRTHQSMMLDCLTGQLAVELSRRMHEMWSLQARGKKLLSFRRFIDDHFQQKLNLGQLAEDSGYSYDRFRHLFKEETGVSPQQYLLSKRIERACDLLGNTDLSISDIASRSGFSTDAQFCKLFKREVGITPGQYREGYRIGIDERTQPERVAPPHKVPRISKHQYATN